jgi:orotidine-5'-phosphate decarboxylase
MRVLADFMQQARAVGLMVIADAKRGDIGSTMEAYSRAWLGEAAPFSCDAITVSPYLGFGALRPAFEQAVVTGTGIFIVVRSSNPEGAYLQGAQVNGEPLADHLAREISSFNTDHLAPNGAGPLGAVIGGTLRSTSERTISLLDNAYCLVPGLGAQGATHADVKAQFSDARTRVIPAASRSILMLGDDREKITSALRRAVDETRELTGV